MLRKITIAILLLCRLHSQSAPEERGSRRKRSAPICRSIASVSCALGDQCKVFPQMNSQGGLVHQRSKVARSMGMFRHARRTIVLTPRAQAVKILRVLWRRCSNVRRFGCTRLSRLLHVAGRRSRAATFGGPSWSSRIGSRRRNLHALERSPSSGAFAENEERTSSPYARVAVQPCAMRAGDRVRPQAICEAQLLPQRCVWRAGPRRSWRAPLESGRGRAR